MNFVFIFKKIKKTLIFLKNSEKLWEKKNIFLYLFSIYSNISVKKALKEFKRILHRPIYVV